MKLFFPFSFSSWSWSRAVLGSLPSWPAVCLGSDMHAPQANCKYEYTSQLQVHMHGFSEGASVIPTTLARLDCITHMAVPHTGPRLCSTLDPDCASHWTLTVFHTGPRLCLTLDSDCAPHWTQTVPHTGLRLCPTLDSNCAPHWTQTVPHTGLRLCPTLDPDCSP